MAKPQVYGREPLLTAGLPERTLRSRGPNRKLPYSQLHPAKGLSWYLDSVCDLLVTTQLYTRLGPVTIRLWVVRGYWVRPRGIWGVLVRVLLYWRCHAPTAHSAYIRPSWLIWVLVF